ncbi:hypothetical protein CK203_015215 [Vitis vinifera]|uniref:Uncharacterized protein n=1 Tax=Vitis vinifera TaxID=29760 RepID=A0A438JJY1_VITVI|nr:hypothetical protein CK203_015215 [Vitis vinifera]
MGLMPFSADAEMMDRKNQTIDQTNRSAPSTDGLQAPAQGSGSAPPAQGVDAPADEDEDVEQERLMDSRIYMQATQGHVVSFGHHELAKYIVGLCPDLIEKTNSKGDTALHIAARKKDLSFVKFAMDSCPSGSGASRDVENAEHPLLRIVNKEGNTVLHEALLKPLQTRRGGGDPY